MSQDFDPLETIVGGELKRLAPLKAPQELSAKVLAQIRAGSQLAWWQQSIWCWPPLARGAFLFVALSIMIVVSGGGFVASPEVQWSWEDAAEKLGALSPLWTALVTLGGWLLTVWERSLQPWLPHIIGVAVTAYLLCLGLGTAVVRYVSRQV